MLWGTGALWTHGGPCIKTLQRCAFRRDSTVKVRLVFGIGNKTLLPGRRLVINGCMNELLFKDSLRYKTELQQHCGVFIIIYPPKFTFSPSSNVRICCSLFYVTVNWIYLGFGLLVRQNQQSKDVTLRSGKFAMDIFQNIFQYIFSVLISAWLGYE